MDVLELLGADRPISIGAMAHIGDHNLGIPVLESGGAFCATMVRAGEDRDEWVAREVKAYYEADYENFGLNILMADNPRIDEDFELVIKMRPWFVTLSAVIAPAVLKKLPGYLKSLHEAGIYVGMLIGSEKHLKLVLRFMGDQCLDFVILEGRPSGGHVGNVDTSVLLDGALSLAKNSGLIVGVGGGIWCQEEANLVFDAGAHFVQIGSAAAVAKESIAHDNFKQAVFEGSETIVTGAKFRHAVRVLRTPFAEELLAFEQEEETTWPMFDERARGSLPNGLLLGDLERGVVTIGKCCKHLTEERLIADIVDDIVGGR